MLSHKREQADLEKMKMFVQLRQDLERVRNLCYMVSRREKLSRTFFRMREQTFHKQAAVLDSAHSLPTTVVQAVIEANHGPSIYDRLYSHNEAEDHTSDFDDILARIAGVKSPTHSGDEPMPEVNGLFKDVKNNPYKKIYYNGSKRRSGSLYGSSLSSASSSDERPKDNKENRVHSSTEEEKPSIPNVAKKRGPSPRKQTNAVKTTEKRRPKKHMPRWTPAVMRRSSPPKKEWGQGSRSRLSQVERELGDSCSDSDELVPIRTTPKTDNQKNVKHMSSIYSDSDSSDVSMKNDDKSSNATNDSQNMLRTKAALKEFSQKPSTSKSPNKSRAKDHVLPIEEPSKVEEKPKHKTKLKPVKDGKEPKEEERFKEVKEKKKEKESKTQDVFDIDKEVEKVDAQEVLAYVPQRQAAKKAAEHIKSGLGKPFPTATEPSPDPEKAKKESEPKAKKEPENKKTETKKEPEPIKPAKVSESKRKSSTNSTSSSSSSTSSSSDTSTSSSSDSEEEPAKPQPRSESLFSTSPRETIKRSTAKDWPFLDKGPRPAASSGSSSSSDSSAPSSPRKPSPPPPSKTTDSPSRAAPEQPKPVRKSADKKQPAPTTKREEPPRPRGRGRGTPRGRPRTSASVSGDRVGDADVRPRDMSDGQRVGVEGEQAKGRKGKQSAGDELDSNAQKEVPKPTKLLSPIRKTDKKLKDSREPELGNLEKEIMERKVGKEGPGKTKSTLDRLFGMSEKGKQEAKPERMEKPKKESLRSHESQTHSLEKPIIAPEKLTVPERQQKSSEKLSKSTEKHVKSLEKRAKSLEKPPKPIEKSRSPEKIAKSPEKLSRSLERVTTSPERPSKPIETSHKHVEKTSMTTERTSKSTEKLTKAEQLLKSPNKDFKEQIEKKSDKESAKESPEKKLKSIEDTSNKLSSSESKENKSDSKKPATPKYTRTSDEITIADKIVNDHLQTQKANDLYNRQTEAIQDVYSATPEIAKSLLGELESEKRNTLKPTGVTNQVLQNISIFSPREKVDQAKDTDLLDWTNLDDIAISKDDEIMKGPLTWNFNTVIREDTREDSARETLNLVEKLRQELSKKSTGCDVDEATTSNEVENERVDFSEQVVPDNTGEVSDKQTPKNQPDEVVNISLEVKVQVSQAESVRHFEEATKQNEQLPPHDYGYGYNCDANLPLETNKNIPIAQHQGLTDHSAPVEGDERWVPPSDNYPNIQSVDPTNYLNDSVPHVDPHYLEQYANATTQEHHKGPSSLNSLPSQLDVRLQEDNLKSQSPSLQERIDRRISQTPLIDPASMDCMPSPSPYANIHPQAKWADSELMPNRRSSSSSAASSTSSGSRRDDEEVRMQDVRLVNHSSLDMAPYLPSQVPPFPPNSLDNFGAYADGSCYPVSLFPPPNLNTQLAFPPTGPAAMFPPAFGAPFPTPHSMPPMPKPVDESLPFSSTCTAAFTSSQHNMALTAAMVNLPPSTPKPMEQQLEEQLLATPTEPPICGQPPLTPADEVAPSPALSNTTPTANSTLPSPSTSLKSNSSAGKKSPSKPTRTSARVTSQMMNKSPAKSPGKSPRQEAAQKQSGPGRGRGDSKRGSGKSGASRPQTASRGRGRGRGRGRSSHHNDYDYIGGGTIHTKLVGTVYDLDFDDDISNDNMTDLKSMRERRKSVDVHEKKFDSFSSIRGSSPRSPKFSSPSQTSHKGRSYNADLRELRPPTPIEDSRSKTDASMASSDNDPPQIFPDVTPVLPGPVDMRTYSSNSSFDQQSYSEQNLLSAFASGTTETQVHDDIDEDFEKELHTALTAKKPVDPPPVEISSNIKVSLSDSRNQLKVKIKGPIANYTSTVAPLPPPTVDPIVVSTINSVTNNAISGASIGMSSGGTSSLRRMRKKELLRQYWTQDMNMDDPTNNTGYTAPAAPPINRTIITIPKAVASMTSIPTKEDYRDYRTGADDFFESKHHRKESKARPGALSRELRQLDLSLDDDGHLERRRSIGSAGSNNSGLSTSFDSALSKRRGRPPRPSQQPTAPKLKIKIGNNTNSIVGASGVDDKKDRIRPPKKRLATMSAADRPSVEDLKRKSMKFRKLMIKDLKTKKKKNKDRDKSEKRKKKKFKSQVQIISNQAENPTKLIIRFGKKSDGDSDKRTSGESSGAAAIVMLNENRTAEARGCAKGAGPSERDAGDDRPPLKLTPIKLKLSRCQEGSGYIMKPSTSTPPSTEKAEEAQAVQPGQPPPGPPSSPPPPPAVSSVPDSVQPLASLGKDCEVR
ncbi:hypothetical protein NQ318_006620 [Aromia moschata]|uniref:Uncharacterized protein n=1 Tax=Aromia moschata TaxID=1265417 RepID=A0AAV8XG35_9CUCU|nr:hypothetical protein NQ318_006620 [Aromia moschata]